MSLAEVPQPDPQQAMLNQEVHREKTEQEIAEQMERISQNIGKRTLALSEGVPSYPHGPIELTDSDTTQSIVKQVPEQSVAFQQEINNEDGQATGNVLIDDYGSVTKNVFGKEPGSTDISIQDGKGRLGTWDGEAASASTELSKEQTIHAAAGILAGARGELAKRENKKSEAVKAATDKAIDDILKA